MKIKLLIMSAAVAATMISCSKEIDDPNRNVPGKEEGRDVELVPMTIEVSSPTKALIDGTKILWEKGDRIAVLDGTGVREFYQWSGAEDGSATTKFQGLVDKDATRLFAVYPYEAAVGLEGEKISASLPVQQQVGGLNAVSNSGVSVGEIIDRTLSFKSGVGYLKIDVSYEDVTEILVSGNGVAGTANFSLTGEVDALSERIGTVSLKPQDEVFAPGSYYVALLPGTTEAGQFSVTMVRKESKAGNFYPEKEITIQRSHVLNFGALDSRLEWANFFAIRDLASWNEFLDKAGEFQKGDVARILNDLDFTGASFEPVAEFAGILDGGFNALTHWATSGKPLFATLSGEVRNLTLDASCALIPGLGAECGFIAGKLLPGGILDNVTNRADITLGTREEDIDGYVTFGTLVGRNEGLMKSCVNEGKIEVRFNKAGGTLRIGGLAGIYDGRENAEGHVSFDGCVNKGAISVETSNSDRQVYLGGIAASSVTRAWSDIDREAGVLRGCVNNADVTYLTDNGGEMENGLAGSNISNIGGIVGYAEGQVNDCENTGLVSAVFPINDELSTTVRPAVGGIAGSVAYGMRNDINRGKVVSSFTAHSASGLTAGVGRVTGPALGGIVGHIASPDSLNQTLSGCHNYGEMDVRLGMRHTAATVFYAGGVAGNCRLEASDCGNHAALSFVAQGYSNLVGGVIGMQRNFGVRNLTNEGAFRVTMLNNKAEYNEGSKGMLVSTQAYGGVVGLAENICPSASGIRNTGDVTVTMDESTDTTSAYTYIAGAIAYSRFITETDITNQGNVTLDAPQGRFRALRIGGLVGRETQGTEPGSLRGRNDGDVSVTVSHAGAADAYIGGVLGDVSRNDTREHYLDNCVNNGRVAVSAGRFYQKLAASGIVASSICSHLTGCVNNGEVYAEANAFRTDDANYSLHVAGVGGIMYGVSGEDGFGCTFTDCSNTGSIRANSDSHYTLIGGIMAQNHTYPAVLSGCTNSGVVSAERTTTSGGAIRIGGIFGSSHQATQVMSCTNEEGGAVNVPETSVATTYIGGIAGYMQTTASLDKCVNKAPVTARTEKAKYVGGILGCAGGTNTVSGCVNEGAVTLGGTTGLSHGAGIVGEISSASTYTGCTNRGAVLYDQPEGECANEKHLGGIIGCGKGSFTATGCINEDTGTVTANCTSPTGDNRTTYIGGIAAYNNQTPRIEGCTNYATLTKNQENFNTCYIGGILSMNSAGTPTLIDNKNYGAIHCNGANTSGNNTYAGILAQTSGMSVLEGNENHGTITLDAVQTANTTVGGIVGYASTHPHELTGNKNFGALVNNAAVTGTLYMAGIVGRFNKSAAVITGCENHGSVTSTAGVATQYLAGFTSYYNKPDSGVPSFTDCINTGDISRDEPGQAIAGSTAIGGFTADNNSVVGRYTRCTNRGNILVRAASTESYSRMHGIVGCTSSGATLNDVHNTGDITFDAKALNTKATYRPLLGGLVSYTPTTTTLTNCSSICNITSKQAGGEGATAALLGGLCGAFNKPTIDIVGCTVGGTISGTEKDLVSALLNQTSQYTTTEITVNFGTEAGTSYLVPGMTLTKGGSTVTLNTVADMTADNCMAKETESDASHPATFTLNTSHAALKTE